ncbi:MAG: response regulator [Planctomycetes bacterium]|nr:response regulator [Planctomycetota bacterium]
MSKVLVCDDNFAIREFCRLELERRGYVVLVANNGQNALDLCQVERPDLVVLDMRMPGLDGQEVLFRLKQLHPQLPVIVHTAHPEEYHDQDVNHLANACVAKDANPDGLIHAVALALALPDAP